VSGRSLVCAAGGSLPTSAYTAFVLLSGGPLHAHGRARRIAQGLIDHAVALGQLQQAGKLLLAGIDVEGELQADVAKADRRLFGHAQRAAKIEIALGANRSAPQSEAQRG